MALKKKWLLVLAGLLLTGGAAHGDEIRQRVEKPVEQAFATRQNTQKENEQWRLQREKLDRQMESLQASIEQLQVKRDELVLQTDTARQRIKEKEQKLESITRIENEMEPFIERLVSEIKALPANGLPFLLVERNDRVQRLEDMLLDPDVAVSEKFRKAMEALQVEMEYGLTIETYQEQVEVESKLLLVNIFRLGRVGLYFQSLDQRSCGIYNPSTRTWARLPEAYNHSLQTAIEIAAKRRPAEIIAMPLGRMVRQ